jgi:endonuclease YncB( thermonuclease family)
LRLANALKALLILALLVGLAALLMERFGARLEGVATAIDGDSLRLGDVEIRLAGIDAPEYGQTCGAPGKLWPCGSVAHRRLRGLVRDGPVQCRSREYDRYGRAVATCFNATGDLAEQMVADGLAVARETYREAEAKARSGKRALWSGPFIDPKDWRDARKPGEQDASSD